MATNKPTLNRVWAEGAAPANVVDPDITSPGKFDAGWLAEVPPFEHFNFLQQMFTQGLVHNNEQGINSWDAITVYPVGALAKGSDGEVYRALVEQAGNDPITPSANWARAFGTILGNDGEVYKYMSCVLRQVSVGSGWDVIDDVDHAPIGVASISESGGNIIINHDFTPTKVGAVNVTPDEGYAASPLTMGPSVGLSSTTISLFFPFEIRFNGTNIATHGFLGADGGATWSAVTDIPNGTYTISHTAQSHTDAFGFPPTTGMDHEGLIDGIGLSSVNKTGFVVNTLTQIAGRTNGVGACVSDNVGPQTTAWDGTDTMTITHPKSSSTSDAMVTSRDSRYHPGVVTSSDTTITVQFHDIVTGALYTGANAPADVAYTRGSMANQGIVSGTDAYVARGPVQLDVTNVADGGSNLWVNGIFQIS